MIKTEDTLPSIDEYIGKQMKKRRLKLNLTLSNLAEKIGVSHQMVTKYESGNTRIPVGALHETAKALGVDFNFFLEGYDDLYKTSHYEASKTITHNCTHPLNILLVEDDPGDLFLMEKIISDLENPVELYHLHDGEQALDFLKGNRRQYDFPEPDIIILDLNIPKRNGHEVLKAIKSDRTLCHIPVIVITSSIIREEMKRVYQNFASGYICKSFDINTMAAAIQQLVAYWGNVTALPNRN